MFVKVCLLCFIPGSSTRNEKFVAHQYWRESWLRYGIVHMSVLLFLFTGIANLDRHTLVNIDTSALESINIVSRKLGELKRDFLFYMKAVANFRNHICYLATAFFFFGCSFLMLCRVILVVELVKILDMKLITSIQTKIEIEVSFYQTGVLSKRS